MSKLLSAQPFALSEVFGVMKINLISRQENKVLASEIE